MSIEKDPEKLYDDQADNWSRQKPSSLSDFTARPAVFSMCGDVKGLDLLDLGCGEGYCTRELASRGTKTATGIDLSIEMVRLAQAQEKQLEQGIDYQQGDVRSLTFSDNSFDLVTAVFVFNYMSIEDMTSSLSEMYRVMRPGANLVFSVPHPAFPFVREPAPPFFFDFEDRGYFSGRDTRNSGQIFRSDGTPLNVQMMHKTLEDYFIALSSVGFRSMPVVRELRVLAEDLAVFPEFMGPLNDIPLHLAIKVSKG